MNTQDESTSNRALAPLGRIDMHSHLLPGVDDGCKTLEESLVSVRRLIDAGFAGTICTPHIVLDLFPANTQANIIDLVLASFHEPCLLFRPGCTSLSIRSIRGRSTTKNIPSSFGYF